MLWGENQDIMRTFDRWTWQCFNTSFRKASQQSLHSEPSRKTHDRVLSMLQTEEHMKRPQGKEQHQVKELKAKVDHRGGEPCEMRLEWCTNTSQILGAQTSIRIWAFILRTKEDPTDFKACYNPICIVKGSFCVDTEQETRVDAGSQNGGFDWSDGSGQRGGHMWETVGRWITSCSGGRGRGKTRKIEKSSSAPKFLTYSTRQTLPQEDRATRRSEVSWLLILGIMSLRVYDISKGRYQVGV